MLYLFKCIVAKKKKILGIRLGEMLSFFVLKQSWDVDK